MAKDYFEKNGKQTVEFLREGEREVEVTEIKRTDEELEAKLGEPFSYDEVVRAVKRMKKSKGVGIDKISSDMLVVVVKYCCIICRLFSMFVGRKSSYLQTGWKAE